MTLGTPTTTGDETDVGQKLARGGWLLFRVSSRSYAIPLDDVAEVVAARLPHLVPLTPLAIGGVVNVRGEPLPVVDGGAVLQGTSTGSMRHALVFERNDQRLGLLVDYVLRIDRDLAPAHLERVLPEPEPERPESGDQGVSGSRGLRCEAAGEPCTAWRRDPEGGVLGIVDSEALLTRAAGLLAGGSGQKEEPCQNAY